MAKHAIIKFPAGNITVKLIKSPATTVWLEQLGIWQKEGIPMSTQRGLMLHNGYEGLKRRDPKHERKCVANINQAIEEVGRLTWGEKFPHKAWVDMPWQQTNKIHRSFTLALLSRKDLPVQEPGISHGQEIMGGVWSHKLTHTELLRYKAELGYNDMYYFKRTTEPAFFYYLKDHFRVNDALEKINHWVHMYENRRYSERAGIFLDKEAPEYIRRNRLPGKLPIEINLTWDNYSPETGGREFLSYDRSNADTFKNSIPEHWMDYDVFLIKSITGKDYETIFQNYDNPMEYDGQNAQDITGGLRIFPNGGHRVLYGDSTFGNWIRSFGLDPKSYAPVPVGKIIGSDFELTNIDSLPDQYNSDGSGAVQEEFRAPVIEIVDVQEHEESLYPEFFIKDTKNFI